MRAGDPFEHVEDAPLFIVPRVLDGLRAYRPALTFDSLGEQERLAAQLDLLINRLLAGIERHPTKFWVLKQFRETLDAVDSESAAARAQVRGELERLMDMLGIDNSDGVLGCDHR